MAYLSNYLSRPGGIPRSRGTGYGAARRYSPYSVPRRGVGPIESAQSPYQGQDLSSALLMQRQASKSALPSNQFDSNYDYDPILAKIQALSSQSVANAKTDAEQLRRQALIASGQTGIGQELGFDANTLAAAQQNPESEYAQLQKEFEQRQKDLIDAMSSQNLLYSGEYATNLANLAQGRASAEGGIGSRLREMLSGIDSGVLQSEETARRQELEAATQAALERRYRELGFDWGTGQVGSLEIPFPVSGYSNEEVAKAVADYSVAHGYQGGHMVVQESHIEVRNGVPGIMVKYITPAGPTTEWTPLPVHTEAPPGPTPYPNPDDPGATASTAAGLHDWGTPAPTNAGAVNPLDVFLGGHYGVG